jgi:hypothetical protein
VADVARIPGVWEQVRLIAGLRWRILRNNLRKKNNQWDLIGMILAGVFGGLAVLGTSVGFFFGAYTFLSGPHEAWIALLFWGIFLFWQLFPVFSAGFGSTGCNLDQDCGFRSAFARSILSASLMASRILPPLPPSAG